MKTRRIVSLLLAVLMIVTALPLTAIIAFATDDPTAQAATPKGTPGEKPSTLPNGKTYAGALLHNYDAAAKWRSNNGGWFGDLGTGVAAMLQDGAEGIMFKIDTSNTTTAGDTLGMTFALNLGFTRKSDGSTTSAYVCATPKLAKTFGDSNQLTVDDVSTWYYSQDGATWQTSSATGTDGTYYLSLPVGKQVTYVYVPMDAFWMQYGEAFFATGTNDASHKALNWQDARELIESYYIKSIRYLFSNATNALVKDTDTTITDWQIVDHVLAVSDLVTKPMGTKDIVLNKWENGSGWFVSNAATLAEPAKGVMFEVDSSAVTGDNLSFFVILSANNAGLSLKDPYMCSSWAQADAYSDQTGDDGTKPGDTSSVFYWSDDGVNWTAVASSASRPSIPKTSDKTYVYMPFESFWSRKSATYLSSGAVSSDSLVDAKEQMDLLGDGWTFRHLYVNTDTNTGSAKFTNWSFVYDPADISDEAPYKMPDGSYYSTKSAFVNGKAFSKNYNNKTFIGAENNSSFVVDGLNNAEGIMFKVDASRVAAGTDKLALWFAWELTGNNGRATYLISNHGAVDVYSDAKDGETTSIWYYSIDGLTWVSVASTSDFGVPLSDCRGEWYVYVPYSSMYIKSGKTFITTGTNNTSEPGMSFLEAREAVGGWKSAARFRMGIVDSGAMGESAVVNDLQFVYKSDKAPIIPTKENLPVVGESLTSPMFKANSYTNPTKSMALAPMGTMNFKDAEGIMIEVDTTAMTTVNPLQFTFWIAAKPAEGSSGTGNYFLATAGRARENANSAIPDDAISVWYWSEDGVNWKAYTSDSTTRYMTLNAKKTTGYIYIPFTSFWSRYPADYINGTSASVDKTKPSISYAEYMAAIGDDYTIAYFDSLFWGNNTDTAGAKLMNWSYVDIDRTKADGAKAPTTLPDTGKDYATVPMFKPEYNEHIGWTTTDGTSFTQADWMSNNVLSSAMIPSTLEYANGIMMKVDTSKVAMEDDDAGVSIAIQAFLPNGEYTNICSSLGRATSFEHAAVLNGATSTWYISNDGKNWLKQTGAEEWYAYLTAQRGILHVYIPTSSMYVKDGETFLKTGQRVVDEPVVSYAEANAMVGGFTKFNEVRIFTSNSTAGHGLTISDVNLVGTPLRVLQSASISMTDDLAYNLYAKLPDDAQNAQVEFTMGGKSVISTGVLEENGITRYTFSNIYPQHLGEAITMTWTATVDGETQVETYTDSLLLYLRKILNEDTYSSWHDLAKALLHYGAATQTYAATLQEQEISASALVNNGIGSITAPVNLAKLPWTAVNYQPDVWTTYTLRLESSLNLKIGVNAPTGISKVFYTVGERSGILSIKDGYVSVPVYAYEMMETVTLSLWNGSSTTLHGSLQVSASAYLKEKYEDGTATDALKDLLQAIANYAQEANLLKGDRKRTTLAAPTLTQIELEKGGGMCYVIQLTDGSFIVIDGGTKTEKHIKTLWTYLVEKSGYTKPVIAAWMFTHQHGDHVDNAFYLLENFSDKMEVQSFAYTWVTEDQLAVDPGDENQYPSGWIGGVLGGQDSFKVYKERDWDKAKEVEETFNNKILPLYPNATLWDMVRGDSKTIGGVNIDILLSARDECRLDTFELNDFSAAWKMTFAGGTTFLVLGDCSADRLEYLRDNNAADLDCDILQATHHGLAGGDASTYQKVAPTITLVSTREDVLMGDYSSYYDNDYNTYLRSVSTVYYNDQAPIITIGANGSRDTVLWSKETVPSVEFATPAYLALVHGNKLSAANNTDKNRTAASKNLYLTAGQRLHLKDNVNYKWAIKLNTSEDYGNNVGNYLPSGGWSTVDTFKAVQDGWYSIVIVKADEKTDFDFNVDSRNLYDYVEVLAAEEGVAPNAMLPQNRNTNKNGDGSQYDGTTERNLYLKAGYTVRLKDNVNYQIAIKKASSETLGTCGSNSWLTSGWSKAPLMIVEDGFYCIVVRNSPGGTNTAFDFTGKNLYDYVQIDAPNIEMTYGHKTMGTSDGTKTRATATKNLYLRKGQTITLNDPGTYQWVMRKASSEQMGSGSGDFYPSGSWDKTVCTYTVAADGWYAIAFQRNSGNFDLGGADSNNLFDYITVS